LDIKINATEKPINYIRDEIRTNLLKRDKKLIIIIDDIDRLNPDEIKEIFRLVKSNTDFPNTIFLLSFDRSIIEKNLELQAGINGKDYLEKIVQVNFDIPYALPQRISQFLFIELDKVLVQLPESREKLFDKTYWTNIYHSGYKNFFNNIRDVKRYINSLSFNISLMFKEKSMEVNPIDFFAIEAIRVFIPEFYSFMKTNKKLFTDTTSDGYSLGRMRENLIEQRKSEIEQSINTSQFQNKSKIKELIIRMFPQLEGVFGNVHYSGSSRSGWSRNLRICSEDYFDAYFTLVPGGSEEELSQYELDSLLACLNDAPILESELRKYIKNGKIRKVLSRFQDYTSETEIIPQSAFRNISLALFNISDEIPFETLHMSDFGADMDIMRIIHQLGKRENNKEINYEIFKEIIPISKGIYGPIKKLSLEIPREKNQYERDYLFPEDKLGELKDLGTKKIYEYYKTGKLIEHPEFLYILYRWKEWGGDKYRKFIDELNSSDEGFISFISKFIYKQKSLTLGDYGEREDIEFKLNNLVDFVEIEEIKKRLTQIIANNKKLYNAHKKDVDLILSKTNKNMTSI
jgi:predicted KAP-like P-loop ATPase